MLLKWQLYFVRMNFYYFCYLKFLNTILKNILLLFKKSYLLIH
uniref:Uncharacterized protein n=1 Tax=Curvibacter symbiont subsp. Hydra magnipapillata TaxID=667019 RepID=C9Y758_CURXX|nr:hypothetical protein Csp_G38460 [Curvibacter putative symbiont of Hydra magnipapillata]